MSVPANDPNPDQGASFYDAPRERPSAADYGEIAAALARFEAKLACRTYLRPRKISHVWIACALLTVAAFAGGLSLARFSFNTPEQPVAVLTRAPELMYLPPQSPAIAFADPHAVTLPNGAPTFAIGPATRATTAEPWRDEQDSSTSATAAVGEFDPNSPERLHLNLHELGRSWAEAVRVANAMHWASNSQQSEPLQHGYAAVEVSAIPEASTGAAVAFAITTILAWSYAANRRTRPLRSTDRDAV